MAALPQGAAETAVMPVLGPASGRTECLGRNNDEVSWQARDKIARGLATSRIPHPFGVGHDIGVERNAHHGTYS